ncbi:MAG: hypothetical protein AAFU73_21500 [Planctomycetota bacterium]
MPRDFSDHAAVTELRRAGVVVSLGPSAPARAAFKVFEAVLVQRFSPAEVSVVQRTIDAPAVDMRNIPDFALVSAEDLRSDEVQAWLVTARREGVRVVDVDRCRVAPEPTGAGSRTDLPRAGSGVPHRPPDGRAWRRLLRRFPEVAAQAHLAQREATCALPAIESNNERKIDADALRSLETVAPCLVPIFERQLALDEEASDLKKRRSRFLTGTQFLGTTAFALVTTWAAGLFEDGSLLERTAPIGALLLILFALGWYWWNGVRLDLHRTFVDVRGLAELLRLEIPMRLAAAVKGDTESRPMQSELATRFLGVDRWLLRIADGSVASVAASARVPAQDVDVERVDWIASYWVRSQANYFEEATQREADRLARLSSWASGLLAASLVGLLVLLTLGPEGSARAYGLAAVTVGFFAAANVEVRANVVVPKEQIQRYRTFARIFRERALHYEGRIAPQTARSIGKDVVKLANRALLEQAIWLAGQRARRVDPVRPL